MIYKILGLFVNTLTADDRYSFLNRDKLWQHLQMQLSQEQKTFSQFFFCILESRFNFEHVKEKDDPQGSCIFDLTDSEKHG